MVGSYSIFISHIYTPKRDRRKKKVKEGNKNKKKCVLCKILVIAMIRVFRSLYKLGLRTI